MHRLTSLFSRPSALKPGSLSLEAYALCLAAGIPLSAAPKQRHIDRRAHERPSCSVDVLRDSETLRAEQPMNCSDGRQASPFEVVSDRRCIVDIVRLPL